MSQSIYTYYLCLITELSAIKKIVSLILRLLFHRLRLRVRIAGYLKYFHYFFNISGVELREYGFMGQMPAIAGAGAVRSTAKHLDSAITGN